MTFNNFAVIIDEGKSSISDIKFKEDVLDLPQNKGVVKLLFKKYDFGIGIEIHHAKELPYIERAIDSNSRQFVENSRRKEHLEPEITYAFLTKQNSEVWLSKRVDTTTIKEALIKKTNKSVIIKSMLSEQDIEEKLKSVKKLSLSIAPEFFMDEESELNKYLSEDIFGYGAAVAHLSYDFDDVRLNHKLLKFIKRGFLKREGYRKLVVSGKDETGMEAVFNLESFTQKVKISPSKDENGNYNFDEVINLLKNAI